MSNVPSCHRTYQKAEILDSTYLEDPGICIIICTYIYIYHPESQKTKTLWHDPRKGVPNYQGAKFGFLDFEGIVFLKKPKKSI